MTDTSRFASASAAGHGWHELPPVFSGMSAVAVRRRRFPTGIVLSAGAVLIAMGAFAAVQTGANLRFDDAYTAYQDARSDAEAARSTLGIGSEELAATTEAAERLVAGNTGILMDGVPLDDLDAAIANANEAAATADELIAVQTPRPTDKPGWFWELYGAADELDAHATDADALVDDLDAQGPIADDAGAAVTATASTVMTAAAAAAPGFEAAHVSARNQDIIALRDAAASVTEVTALDDVAVSRFNALQAAATQVVVSQDAELAEKAGPLLGARLEVEAYARSLAPGVLIEFDWAPVVNGFGGDGGMGGYTTWWWDEPDRSVILLSNSVAEQWPAARSKALIAHEVGHAISVKCEDMYDSSTQDSIEKWATAWAISMGHTDDANGVWAYGYPPESYITAAAGCR